MSSHEDRQRVLRLAAEAYAKSGDFFSQVEEMMDDGDPLGVGRDAEIAWELANCVAIPREDYDRLRRALWALMRTRRYPDGGFGAGALPDFVSMGFVAGVRHGDDDGVGTWEWTTDAHEFAREMEGEK